MANSTIDVGTSLVEKYPGGSSGEFRPTENITDAVGTLVVVKYLTVVRFLVELVFL